MIERGLVMKFSRYVWLSIVVVVCGACFPPVAAANSDDDAPVAEGPAKERVKADENAPPGGDNEEILKAVEVLRDAADSNDRLEEAIEGMRNAQKRLAGSDTSPETQKIQGRVVTDLEGLLALLKMQQQNRQNNPQSSSDQNPDRNRAKQRPRTKKPDPQDPDPRSGQRSDDKTPDSEERSDAARAKAAHDARREQMIKDVWGQLPPHLREAMRNALRENYLPKYDELIKKYYESLAEKNRKRHAR
jgi:hypothetical protein